jgi:hypothetical protein
LAQTVPSIVSDVGSKNLGAVTDTSYFGRTERERKYNNPLIL